MRASQRMETDLVNKYKQNSLNLIPGILWNCFVCSLQTSRAMTLGIQKKPNTMPKMFKNLCQGKIIIFVIQ